MSALRLDWPARWVAFLCLTCLASSMVGCAEYPQVTVVIAPTVLAADDGTAAGPPIESPAPLSLPAPDDAEPTLTPSAPQASPSISLRAAGLTPTPRPALSATLPALTGRLLIPSLDVDAPVVEVSWHLEEIEGQTLGVWETVSGAVGHHRGTAAFGGQGNCVLSGHSRAAEGGVFQRLDELEPGDLILLRTPTGNTYRYEVESLDKLPELGADLAERRAHAAVMAPTQDARLTLITCWPDWAYTHRLVVIARLI